MRSLLAIAALATLLVPPVTASARVLRVQKAPPLPPGSFGNIQLAINNSAPGDTISIGDGRYREFFPYTWESSGQSAQTILAVEWSLTFIGDSRDGVRIGPEEYLAERNGDATLCMIQLRAENTPSRFENLTFENTFWLMSGDGSFTMENCRATTPGQGGLALGAPDSVRFLRCLFEGIEGIGVWVTFGSVLTAREVVFEESTFQNIRTGFALNAVQSARVERCVFLDGLTGAQVGVGTHLTMEDCRFERIRGTGFGILSGSIATLHRCQFLGSLAHTAITIEGGRLFGSGNYIEGARQQTIAIFTPGTISMQNNTILNAGGWSVLCGSFKEDVPGTESFDMTNNFWGTTDSAQIREWIGDEEENPLLMRIDFEPVLESSVGTSKRSFGSFKDLFRGTPASSHERE